MEPMHAQGIRKKSITKNPFFLINFIGNRYNGRRYSLIKTRKSIGPDHAHLHFDV